MVLGPGQGDGQAGVRPDLTLKASGGASDEGLVPGGGHYASGL